MSLVRYSGRLFPIDAGQLITITGRIINYPNRVDFDLLTGNGCEDDAGDIQLHISVRFNNDGDEPNIVRNTHSLSIGWANEEMRECLFPFNGLNPFKHGGDFKLDIYVDHYAFFVSIDGKPYCTFNHRMPFQAIQLINISRDVEAIYQVNQTSSQLRPWPAPNPNTFEAFVPRQFNPGNVVVLTAIPKGNPAGDFSLNFYDGQNRFRTHFHIRVYFDSGCVGANSQDENEGWFEGTHHYPDPNPFVLHQRFKLAVAITNGEFHVAANGQRFISYPFKDNYYRLFGSMTGIALICNKGLNLQIQSVDYKFMDYTCNGFENFTIF